MALDLELFRGLIALDYPGPAVMLSSTAAMFLFIYGGGALFVKAARRARAEERAERERLEQMTKQKG